MKKLQYTTNNWTLDHVGHSHSLPYSMAPTLELKEVCKELAELGVNIKHDEFTFYELLQSIQR